MLYHTLLQCWALTIAAAAPKSESRQVCTFMVTPWTIHTVHGILQARILEWVAFPFSRGSSQPRNRTQVSRIADRFFTS